MKMSRKTRIVSILMCIALMAGVLSVGMMANAANNTTAAVYWIDPWGAGPNWGGYVTSFIENNTVMSVETTDERNMYQIGSYMDGGYSQASLDTLDNATGLALAVRVDQAYRASGEKMATVDFVVKLEVSGLCFSSQKNNIAANGTVAQLVYPFTDFKCETGGNRQGQPMTADDIAAIEKVELDLVSYASNWGNNIKDVKMLVSQVFAYTDTADVITLPGDESEQTTPAPTTPAPQTTTKKEEPVVTTTQAPTTLAPTTAPVVEEKEAKPAKVKGVKVKAGKKKVTVTWKKAKNAKKYTVKYSYKKNMKGAKTKTVKAAKVVLKKLKSGKKVYVQVCGVNGKTKGAFSKKVAKKVK